MSSSSRVSGTGSSPTPHQSRRVPLSRVLCSEPRIPRPSMRCGAPQRRKPPWPPHDFLRDSALARRRQRIATAATNATAAENSQRASPSPPPSVLSPPLITVVGAATKVPGRIAARVLEVVVLPGVGVVGGRSDEVVVAGAARGLRPTIRGGTGIRSCASQAPPLYSTMPEPKSFASAMAPQVSEKINAGSPPVTSCRFPRTTTPSTPMNLSPRR